MSEIKKSDHYRNIRREIIAKHLDLSSKLEEVADEILERGISVDEGVAKYYGIEFFILSQKVKIKKRKAEFYKTKSKFELAVKEYFEGKNTTIKNIARKYGISYNVLRKEIKTIGAQKSEKYAYDRTVTSNKNFTYLQEESLLDELKNWSRTDLKKICPCQICAMEKLSTLAYEFAQNNSILCFPLWTISKQTDVNWLLEFEMRHSNEIYEEFEPSYCLEKED